MEKKALLCVSFGTSNMNALEADITSVERSLAAAFGGYEVRRAFTSGMIRRKLAGSEGLSIPGVTEALNALLEEGFTEVIVQPTHMMCGYEYDKAAAETAAFAGRFEVLRMGRPVLAEQEDLAEMAKVMTQLALPEGKDTAVVFMGHGSEHEANKVYGELAKLLPDSCVIGTVEAEPSLEDALAEVKRLGVHRVVLRPLMIVAGDHACNDMAGESEDSWKSVFARAGFDVTCRLCGLGRVPALQQMIAAHAARAGLLAK